MHRQSACNYAGSAPTQSRYPATSSAFSASANPNEDWTKISDLAERRRIQNRIAQRNYRKKLKKRLEDLERRAASNSASPEQHPAELQSQNSQQQRQQHAVLPEGSRPSMDYARVQHPTTEASHNGFLSLPDDRMFSHQYTRQLSTSPPPPFSYGTLPSETIPYPPFTSSAIPYTTTLTPSCSDLTLFPQYMPPISSSYPSPLPSIVYPVKQELYPEDDMNPFNMQYATMAGIDITAAQSYSDVVPQTPPLTECFDRCCSGSPPESTAAFPRTPASYPPSPPITLFQKWRE